ncbi:CHAP domain-containing protein [Dictyobacter vulcani]|nr:CHAP domain-containing protein [Dictyobacter vulcani]
MRSVIPPQPLARPSLWIPGNGMKKTVPVAATPLQGRSLIVHGAISILSIFLAVGGIMALVPVDKSEHLYASFSFPFYTTSVRKNDTALIQAQSATATAVTVDGFDPGGGRVYAGVKVAPLDLHVSAVDIGNLHRFFYGQCTYWANQRYHQETGHWIPWLGNAYQWAYQAPAYGWNLSSTPNPRGASIMVFGPYAQGAGAYGHVAVVEKVNADGSVLTSNWNWNGDWATLTWHTFYPGRGISFLWYPD